MQSTLRWKNNKYYIFWVCVCSLRFPECNAHASYSHPWPQPLYKICPHYLINGTIFGKTLLNIKSVLILSTTFVWTIFHSNKNWARYDQKRILVFMYSTRYSCQILMKLEVSQQFWKILKISKFFHWEQRCSMRRDRRTDRHDANTPLSQFGESF